jgi:hypothetical protein
MNHLYSSWQTPSFFYKQMLDLCKLLHYYRIQITKRKQKKDKNKLKHTSMDVFTEQQEALVNSSWEAFKKNIPQLSILFYTL